MGDVFWVPKNSNSFGVLGISDFFFFFLGGGG